MNGGAFPLWTIAIIIPVAFVAIWTFVMLILSRVSGWGRLAAAYPARVKPEGAEFGGVSGMIGAMRYKNALTVAVSPDGLYLAPLKLFSIGHRPLLVPWHAIRNARLTQGHWFEIVDFDIGEPPITRVRLPRSILESAPLRFG